MRTTASLLRTIPHTAVTVHWEAEARRLHKDRHRVAAGDSEGFDVLCKLMPYELLADKRLVLPEQEEKVVT